jgi:hypothetical protein
MKIHKSYLKQLIKEEIADLESRSSAQPPWIDDMKNILLDAQNLYKSMPEEGKQHFTQNFKMYARKWEEELNKTPEDY